MAILSAPDVTPTLPKDKSMLSGTFAQRKGNSIATILIAVILLLLIVGVGRLFYRPSVIAQTVKVVAAGGDIPPGCRIGFTSLHYLEIPKNYLTAQMVTSYPEVVGRVSRSFIAQGEPIIESMLFEKNRGPSLSIDTSQRAMTLNLSEEALVDHSIAPGDYVDVVATITKDGKKYTKTICQSLSVVMAIPKDALISMKMRSGEQNRITLAVTPVEAEKLAEAMEIGKIRLLLRNRLARAFTNSEGISEVDLLPPELQVSKASSTGSSPVMQQVLPPPPPPLPTSMSGDFKIPTLKSNPLNWIVEVFTGSHKETYTFPQAGK